MVNGGVERAVLFRPLAMFPGDFEIRLDQAHSGDAAKAHHDFGPDQLQLLPQVADTGVLLGVQRVPVLGRADYLPCISWGSLAAHCGGLDVGDRLRLEGRLQSRQYHKLIDGEQVERTAFEISVMNLLPEDGDQP